MMTGLRLLTIRRTWLIELIAPMGKNEFFGFTFEDKMQANAVAHDVEFFHSLMNEAAE